MMSSTKPRQGQLPLEAAIFFVWLFLLTTPFIWPEWTAPATYLIPILALLTFFMLPRFSMLLMALCLSSVIYSETAGQLQGSTKLLLIGFVWLAVCIVLLRQWYLKRGTNQQPFPELKEPDHSSSSLPIFDAKMRHDLRTPVKMISFRFGSFNETSLRLFSRAPLISIYSCIKLFDYSKY